MTIIMLLTPIGAVLAGILGAKICEKRESEMLKYISAQITKKESH